MFTIARFVGLGCRYGLSAMAAYPTPTAYAGFSAFVLVQSRCPNTVSEIVERIGLVLDASGVTDCCSQIVAKRRAARRFMLEAEKPKVLIFGEDILVPSSITKIPKDFSSTFVLQGESFLNNRLLDDLMRHLTVPRFAFYDERTEGQIILRACSLREVPAWMPFTCAPEGTHAYCSCSDCIANTEGFCISKFFRHDDPYVRSNVHVVAEHRGFILGSHKLSPNYVRRPGDIEVGAYTMREREFKFWSDWLIYTVGGLVDPLTKARGRLVMDSESQVGWFKIDPDLVLFIKHTASTQGNQILRRDLSEIKDWYSRAYMSRKAVSLGLGTELARRTTAHATLEGQGGLATIPTWLFLRMPEAGFYPDLEEAEIEAWESHRANIKKEQKLQEEEIQDLLEDLEKARVEKEDLLEQRSLWDDLPKNDKGKEKEEESGWVNHHGATAEWSSFDDCPTTPSSWEEMTLTSSLQGLGISDPYPDFSSLTISSPRVSSSSASTSSPADPPVGLPSPPRSTPPTLPPSRAPPVCPTKLSFSQALALTQTVTECPPPKRPLPLPSDFSANSAVVRKATVEGDAMDPLVNERKNEPVDVDFISEKLSFKEHKPYMVYASNMCGESHLAQEIADDSVIKTVERNNEPFKAPGRSGYLAGVVVGLEPIVFGSDSATVARSFAVRMGRKVKEAVERVKYKGITYKRMDPKKQFWPRHLKVTEADLPAWTRDKDFVAVAESGGTLLDLCKRMNANSRKRVIRLINQIESLNVTFKDEMNTIKCFVKSDDKVFKPKPRVIQFVPTVSWIRSVLKVEALVKKIKTCKNWSWRDDYSGWGGESRNGKQKYFKQYTWASGMTQKQLFKAVNSDLELADGEKVLICGDDNTDSKVVADATMYDAHQQGPFADCQAGLGEQQGFTRDELKELGRVHLMERTGGGMTVILHTAILPSGVVWTLLWNTMGLVVYHGQVARVLWASNGTISMEEAHSIAADLLGLDMKVETFANLDQTPFAGADFLKHLFVPFQGKIYPVQLPSRICKWGCKNLTSDRATQPDMIKHIGGVALGQKPFLLEPFFTGPFVEGWAPKGKKASLPRWVNITPDSADPLECPSDSSAWEDACAVAIESRYGLSRAQLEEARKLIQEGAGRTGTYHGKTFAVLAARDYLGWTPQV